jgi:S1-C subfamily serine protease
MYFRGSGIPKDVDIAVSWFNKAAEQDILQAQINLAYVYAKGKVVPLDKIKAAKWYLKAAEHGGGEAMRWYHKAAELGDAQAQNTLGWRYSNGIGVKQDYVEAEKWYRKAAEQGYASALFRLGYMYHEGKGVKKDEVKAAQWYRRAAEQEVAEAQYNLGVLYAYGKGVMHSPTAAADWFYKAGVTYLRNGERDKALKSIEQIKNQRNVPNAFLADKLLKAIYSGSIPKGSQQTPVKETAVSLGTGWSITRGYVVTNYHVVSERKKIKLLLVDGTSILASVEASDRANDLAILSASEKVSLPAALPLATKIADVGSKVFTIGYPHPDLMGKEPKLTDGIVSSLSGIGNDPRVYQISVPIQSGNSGGPLLNMNGEVVGIVVAKLRAAKVLKLSGDLPQNVNYAVKAGYLRMLVESLPIKQKDMRTLPVTVGSLEQLNKRIRDSVMIVIAE